ncbi:MAG: hypothetical protein UV38_C0001G0284 [candidate division TM6 bacterium GW2011_GWE2_42_60]|nr:MAG: hypothetical protein UV38_C0001G0284 [candidate division TM6 bacterium GW2011_GWE2_42_60]HBY05523.1 hypothetical protein [Candidatus Dependentiae bacterium]
MMKKLSLCTLVAFLALASACSKKEKPAEAQVPATTTEVPAAAERVAGPMETTPAPTTAEVPATPATATPAPTTAAK